MSVSKFFKQIIIPLIVKVMGAKKGTWKSKKYTTLIISILSIPVKRLKGLRRTSKVVEMQYDEIAGAYIQDNYYSHKLRYSVVNGDIKEISSIDNMREIRLEIRDKLSECKFKTVLEVGVGELTTLEDIYQCFGPNIECFGVDLSLNRIRHGLEEFKKRHVKHPVVAKANATKLPFPDNSFDLVVTRHTLEQMPHIYQDALDEILRVSKNYVYLFEPSYELGSLTQKLKMLNNDYVRGIPAYLNKKSKITVHSPYLMKNSANPLNHTACYKISKNNASTSKNKKIPLVCPITKSELEMMNNYFYSEKAKRAFPIFDGIPVLDEEYSIIITR